MDLPEEEERDDFEISDDPETGIVTSLCLRCPDLQTLLQSTRTDWFRTVWHHRWVELELCRQGSHLEYAGRLLTSEHLFDSI
mgnify:CR=1 FL=1